MLTLRHARKIAERLGPELITGAADDDPSGLATYSQAGAQFGAGLLWTLTLTTPLMIGIQMVSARIGWVTGAGLAANICRVMPRWLAITLVTLLVLANTLNIAADIAAMGDALQLVVGGPHHGHALVFGLLCAVLPVWLNYEATVRVLKWLTLALLSYVGVVLVLHVDWMRTLEGTLIPNFQKGENYWMMIVGVLGTTISPYLFFWQAAQESEQRQQVRHRPVIVHSALFMREHLYRIKLDTVFGMCFSNVIAFCVMLASAMALHQHGITDIQTTRQAALALQPIAGEFAFTLFALGIIGTGLLAVPVLAGSAAYAVADVFKWRSGLDHTLAEAKGFYGILIFATAAGTLLGFTPLDPIKALIWSAVINGVIAVPIMAVMMRLGADRNILGDQVLTLRHQMLGWLATLIMLGAVVGMIYTWLRGSV
ncbi:MAG: divalent metal cation transporter [Burkholderiaceae bacterium]|nr:MAG: divalent metal cation transporter [Burkholderiaceae bacterium]